MSNGTAEATIVACDWAFPAHVVEAARNVLAGVNVAENDAVITAYLLDEPEIDEE